jgi:hypothetical protein
VTDASAYPWNGDGDGSNGKSSGKLVLGNDEQFVFHVDGIYGDLKVRGASLQDKGFRCAESYLEVDPNTSVDFQDNKIAIMDDATGTTKTSTPRAIGWSAALVQPELQNRS